MDSNSNRYNKALERARKIYNQTEFDYEKGLIEDIFPELHENNDEKIRKILIGYFNRYKEQEECGVKTFYGIPTDDILTWLEKQEQKSTINIDIDKMVKEYKDNKEYDEEFSNPVNCMIRSYRQGLNDAIKTLQLKINNESNQNLKFKVGNWT